jgi:hypothetical protein
MDTQPNPGLHHIAILLFGILYLYPKFPTFRLHLESDISIIPTKIEDVK